MVVTSTAFVDLLGDGKVELISTAPIVAALYWMIDGLQHPTRVRFLLIGVLLGFAIIARPYNIFLVPVFTLLFYLLQVWPILRKNGLKAAWNFARPALWMLPSLLVMGVFHLWQNDLWLGSLFAPLTYARDLDIRDWQWQFDPSLLTMLKWLYPFTLTFFNTPQSLGNLSPLWVGFLPFLFLPAVRRGLTVSSLMCTLLAAVLLTLLVWVTFFFTIVEVRYVWFLWMSLSLPAAKVMESAIEHSGRYLEPLWRPLLTLLLVFLGLRTLTIALDTYSPIRADDRAFCYDVPLCTFFEPVNEQAAPGERVFVLNAYRYYLRPDLFACSSRAEEYPALEKLARQNSPDFWVEAYHRGFRYVIFESNFAEFHSHFGTIPAPQNAPAWLNVFPMVRSGGDAVYRLDAESPPFPVTVQCRQDKHGKWILTAGR